MRRWLPLLPVAAALAFNACGGGGCGEPAPESGGGVQAPASAGRKEPARQGAPITGGQPPDLSYFDSRKNPKVLPQGGGAPDQAPAPPLPRRAQGPMKAPRADWLPVVAPPEWRDKVLRAQGPVLVMTGEPGCPDCALAGSALKWLTQDFAAWKFWRLDTADPDAAPLLPEGLRGARPGFVMYQDGKAGSLLPRLPFKRSPPTESDNDYRQRLYRWFRDALNQKDLTFGQRR